MSRLVDSRAAAPYAADRVPRASLTALATITGANAASVSSGSMRHITAPPTTANSPRPTRSATPSIEPRVMLGGSSRKRLIASPGGTGRPKRPNPRRIPASALRCSRVWVS